jgi:hypothetical protein
MHMALQLPYLLVLAAMQNNMHYQLLYSSADMASLARTAGLIGYVR